MQCRSHLLLEPIEIGVFILVIRDESTPTLAIYAVADDKYTAMAVMALRSFQRWHSEFGYFLLGTVASMSQRSLDLIKRYNIELVNVDESQTFIRRGKFKGIHIEYFYPLKGPELLAERGYEYSLEVDGDVMASRPMDLANLYRMLGRMKGYAARPVGTVERARVHGRSAKHRKFDYSHRSIFRALGIRRWTLLRKYEHGNGVVFWNNTAMAEYELFRKCTHVFKQCKGYFNYDQDLLAFTAAAYDIPVLELGHPYHFAFFEDSRWIDRKLRRRLNRGEFDAVFIVHFLFCKPWLPLESQTPVKIHFVNEWRKYVHQELGSEADRYFEDLSPIDPSVA